MKLSIQLKEFKYDVGPHIVSSLLKSLGYTLQLNKKVFEGKQHPDRDEQFKQIQENIKTHIEEGNPVISVDAKKKEI